MQCLVEEHELSLWLPEPGETYDLSLFGRITQSNSHQCLGRKWHRSADISVRNCLVFLRKLLVRASSHRSSSCRWANTVSTHRYRLTLIHRSRAENCSKIPCAMVSFKNSFSFCWHHSFSSGCCRRPGAGGFSGSRSSGTHSFCRGKLRLYRHPRFSVQYFPRCNIYEYFNIIGISFKSRKKGAPSCNACQDAFNEISRY